MDTTKSIKEKIQIKLRKSSVALMYLNKSHRPAEYLFLTILSKDEFM